MNLTETRTRSERFETPRELQLRLSSPSGKIDVASWDEAAVEVVVDSDDPDLLERTTIEMGGADGKPELTVRVPSLQREQLSWAHFVQTPEVIVRIRVPHGSDLDVESRSADVRASGSYGLVGVETAGGSVEIGIPRSATVKTASGDITIEAVNGDLNAASTGGSIQTGPITGTATLTTKSGDIKLQAATGKVEAETVGGSIEAGVLERDAQMKTRSGDIKLRSAGGRAQLETIGGSVKTGRLDRNATVKTASGDITIEAVNGDLNAASTGGSIQTGPITGTATLTTKSGDIKLQAATGKVEAETVGGSIELGLLSRGAEARTHSGDIHIADLTAGDLSAHTTGGQVWIGVRTGHDVPVDAWSTGGKVTSDIDLDATSEDGDPSPAEIAIQASSRSGDVRIARVPDPAIPPELAPSTA